MTTHKKSSSRRVRFSVPEADESVLLWLDAQHNVSASMRYLIRDYIVQRGINDPLCAPVTFSGKAVKNNKPESSKTDDESSVTVESKTKRTVEAKPEPDKESVSSDNEQLDINDLLEQMH